MHHRWRRCISIITRPDKLNILYQRMGNLCIPGTSHVSESFHLQVTILLEKSVNLETVLLHIASFLCPNSKREMILFLGLGRYPIRTICCVCITFFSFPSQFKIQWCISFNFFFLNSGAWSYMSQILTGFTATCVLRPFSSTWRTTVMMKDIKIGSYERIISIVLGQLLWIAQKCLHIRWCFLQFSQLHDGSGDSQ